MTRFLFVVCVLLLFGCATQPAGISTTTPAVSQPMPPPVPQQHPVYVRTSNYALNQPREAETKRLQQIAQLLMQAQMLASEARVEADASQRIVFDYHTMLLDLHAIEFGLTQHFLMDIRAPRLPTPVNHYQVRGDYTRINH